MESSTIQYNECFQCKRCGHQSKLKSNLLKHLRNKKTCFEHISNIDRSILIDELLTKQSQGSFECPHCSRRFNKASSKSRHLKNCKKSPLKDMTCQVPDFVQVVNELQTKVKELEAQLKTNSNMTTNNTTTHNTNNGIINQNHVVINAFGNEDISYLTEHKGFTKFMVNCIRSKAEGVVDFIAKKHFHPDHPENHNVRKLNKKDDFIEVRTGKEWKTRFSDDVVYDLFSDLEKVYMRLVEAAFIEGGSINKQLLDTFMRTVGAPLEWDLTTDNYEYLCDKPLTDDEKDKMRNKIYRLVIEEIYKRSKSLHSF